MIEHPDITRNFAVEHYNQLLEDASQARYVRNLENNEKPTGFMSALKSWTGDLKVGARPVRKVATRA